MKKISLNTLGGLVLAGILVVAGDLVLAWQGIDVPCSLFAVAGVVLWLLLFLLNRRKPVQNLKTAGGLLVLLLILSGGLYLCWKTFSDQTVFDGVDSGKRTLYGEQKVMVIVPHQDDELNLLGVTLTQLGDTILTIATHRSICRKT